MAVHLSSSVCEFYDCPEPGFPPKDINSTSWVIVKIKGAIHFMIGAI